MVIDQGWRETKWLFQEKSCLYTESSWSRQSIVGSRIIWREIGCLLINQWSCQVWSLGMIASRKGVSSIAKQMFGVTKQLYRIQLKGCWSKRARSVFQRKYEYKFCKGKIDINIVKHYFTIIECVVVQWNV